MAAAGSQGGRDEIDRRALVEEAVERDAGGTRRPPPRRARRRRIGSRTTSANLGARGRKRRRDAPLGHARGATNGVERIVGGVRH